MQAPCRHRGHPWQPSTLRSTLPMPRQDSDDDDDKTTNIVGEDYICINLFDVMTMIKTQILLMFSIFDDCRLQPLRECSSWTARAQTRGTWTSSSPSLFKLRQNSRGPFRACPRELPRIRRRWSSSRAVNIYIGGPEEGRDQAKVCGNHEFNPGGAAGGS